MSDQTDTSNPELDALLAKHQAAIDAAVDKKLNEALTNREHKSFVSTLPSEVREDALKLLKAGATSEQVKKLYAPVDVAQPQTQQVATTQVDQARPTATTAPQARDFGNEIKELNKLPFAEMFKRIQNDPELRAYSMAHKGR